MAGQTGKRGALTARLAGDRSGAAALEFAFVAPVFVLVLLGLCCWGGYFWLSHSVQQLANDAARSAMAGLDAGERQGLAKTSLDSDIQRYAPLTASRASLTMSDDAQALSVTVAYDASDFPFFALTPLVPMPSSTIRRTATVRQGGY